jgi:hypothetical protein
MKWFSRLSNVEKIRVLNVGPTDILVVNSQKRLTREQAEIVSEQIQAVVNIPIERIIVLPPQWDMGVIKQK